VSVRSSRGSEHPLQTSERKALVAALERRSQAGLSSPELSRLVACLKAAGGVAPPTEDFSQWKTQKVSLMLDGGPAILESRTGPVKGRVEIQGGQANFVREGGPSSARVLSKAEEKALAKALKADIERARGQKRADLEVALSMLEEPGIPSGAELVEDVERMLRGGVTGGEKQELWMIAMSVPMFDRPPEGWPEDMALRIGAYNDMIVGLHAKGKLLDFVRAVGEMRVPAPGALPAIDYMREAMARYGTPEARAAFETAAGVA
jgi:hypothetical protein